LAPCLRIQKFRSRRPALSVKSDCTSPRKSAFCVAVIRDLWLRCSYSGLRPSASNCRPHSVGGSRSRSMRAAGQATFYGCLNKIECEEGERDGHIDLPNAPHLPTLLGCTRRIAQFSCNPDHTRDDFFSRRSKWLSKRGPSVTPTRARWSLSSDFKTSKALCSEAGHSGGAAHTRRAYLGT
jgi:hypothetical protein